jgi:hypothetical protein
MPARWKNLAVKSENLVHDGVSFAFPQEFLEGVRTLKNVFAYQVHLITLRASMRHCS